MGGSEPPGASNRHFHFLNHFLNNELKIGAAWLDEIRDLSLRRKGPKEAVTLFLIALPGAHQNCHQEVHIPHHSHGCPFWTTLEKRSTDRTPRQDTPPAKVEEPFELSHRYLSMVL